LTGATIIADRAHGMESETRILFVDTNGFLQVRDLKDIPWTDLFPSIRAVDVMVAPRVIEELDKHKTSTNQRRRDRARLALRLIESASLEPDLALVVRDKPIRVRVVISTALRLDWAEYPTLDSSKPDDQLVAEAISFGNGAAILSHDTGPRIRARIAKIESFSPPDTWLLPIEQTDDQRKISKLERDLEQALSRFPKIVAGFENFDEQTSEIQLIRPILPPLDSTVAQRLAREYLSRHPRSRLQPPAPNRIALQFGGISEEQVESYNAEYSAFENNVQAYFANIHERVRRVGAIPEISYFVKNDSGVVAEGLRIEFDLEGKGHLLANRDGRPLGNAFQMPKPPEPPSRFDYSRFALPSMPTLHGAMDPRDPVGFYWFDRPANFAKHSALQCEEFRATREFRDSIFVSLLEEPHAELHLRLHISAANLPQPIYVSAKLVIAEQVVKWSDQIVQTILPKKISSQL
jgi:hypothetical protein